MDRDVALDVLTAVTAIKTAVQTIATNTAPANRAIEATRILEIENLDEQVEEPAKETKGGK